MTIRVTNEWKFCPKGLVDYLADAIIVDEGGNTGDIPCQVGFCEGFDEIEATHIFIGDGITDKGCHYYKDTIEVNDNYTIDNSINERR